MKNKKIVDLEKVWITPEVRDAWLALVPRVVEALHKIPGLTSADIPDEMFEVLPDGSGKIFCEKLGVFRVELGVPHGHWLWAPLN